MKKSKKAAETNVPDTAAKPVKPEKMTGKEYTKELRKLQGQLCGLQEWVK